MSNSNGNASDRTKMSRAERFIRARLYQIGSFLEDAAITPRFTEVRRRGWEAGHVNRLRHWVSAGFAPKVILDIGANAGEWCEMCEELFAPDLCVLVEPQRSFQEIIQSKSKKAGRNWTLLALALGERQSELELHLTENRAASSLLPPKGDQTLQTWGVGAVAVEKVKVERLDDLWRQGAVGIPDLVKIDVQGFEAQVISGGREVLSHAKRMVVEVSLAPIYEGQALIGEIVGRLGEMDFIVDDISEACRTWPDGKLWQVDLWVRKK